MASGCRENCRPFAVSRRFFAVVAAYSAGERASRASLGRYRSPVAVLFLPDSCPRLSWSTLRANCFRSWTRHSRRLNSSTAIWALRADHCPNGRPYRPRSHPLSLSPKAGDRFSLMFCPFRFPVIEDDEPKPDSDGPLSGRSRRTRCRGCRARPTRPPACGLCRGSPWPRGAGSRARGSCSDRACSCHRPRDKRRIRLSAPR